MVFGSGHGAASAVVGGCAEAQVVACEQPRGAEEVSERMASGHELGMSECGQEGLRPVELGNQLIAGVHAVSMMRVDADQGGQVMSMGELPCSAIGQWGEVLGVGDLDGVDHSEEVVCGAAQAAAEDAVEGMGYDDEAALLVDGLGGFVGGPAWADVFAEKQADEVAIVGGDFLADDDLRASVCRGRQGQSPFDGVVVGHRQAVDAPAMGAVQQVLDSVVTVVGEVGVHMKDGLEQTQNPFSRDQVRCLRYP